MSLGTPAPALDMAHLPGGVYEHIPVGYGTSAGGYVGPLDDVFGAANVIPYTQTPPLDAEVELQEQEDFATYLGHPDLPPAGPYHPSDADAAALAQQHQIHDALGPESWRTELVANEANPGIPNLGPAAPPSSYIGVLAREHIVPHESAAEEGWGVSPAVARRGYPNTQGANPFYRMGTRKRMGDFEVLSEPQAYAIQSVVGTQSLWTRLGRHMVRHGAVGTQPAPLSVSDSRAPSGTVYNVADVPILAVYE